AMRSRFLYWNTFQPDPTIGVGNRLPLSARSISHSASIPPSAAFTRSVNEGSREECRPETAQTRSLHMDANLSGDHALVACSNSRASIGCPISKAISSSRITYRNGCHPIQAGGINQSLGEISNLFARRLNDKTCATSGTDPQKLSLHV